MVGWVVGSEGRFFHPHFQQLEISCLTKTTFNAKFIYACRCIHARGYGVTGCPSVGHVSVKCGYSVILFHNLFVMNYLIINAINPFLSKRLPNDE